MAVKLNQHDLEFILKQIVIAERHAAGEDLYDILGSYILPYGLRTVDGSYNNLVDGRERWGASDEILPRMFTPNYIDENDGDSFDPDGPGPAPTVTNNDYGAPGSVADADPRMISNLIVDQTPGNPAAISAALKQTGYGGDEMAAIQVLNSAWTDFEAGTMTREDYVALADTYGLSMQGDSLIIPNTAPDAGLSSPFNAWMTYFGQFFDHGLDLIPKADNGTVYIPLQPDDPLYDAGPDGIAGNADDGHTNFMVMTRAQIDENGETKNFTTPFVDQNQTYGSHASKQIFMREYELVDGKPQATGHLLEGANGGLATWADVKAQARDILGIELTDKDMFNIPLIRSDPYGNFIPDANGFPQVVTGIGADGIPNTADDDVASGTPGAPVHLLLGAAGEIVPAGASVVPVRTAHNFLDDIAHTAVPVIVNGNLVQDADSDTGNAVASVNGRNTEYDNELLDRHFITGDGRGNENIALTTVHHVFHSEHNRQVEANKLEILKSADATFINEWLDVDISQGEATALAGMTDAQLVLFGETLDWDGERMFQVAKFATEMQYQHLVFEEFARRIQPNIDPFVFNTTTDINPAIFAEFAHVVYRFGHSMLTEDVNRLFLNDAGQPVTYDELGNEVVVTDLESWGNNIGLIEAFLNPVEFDRDGAITADQAAGAIYRGLNREHGNHIDEFVTDALRNNLLGLPLDLAAINIARGRDTGMPTLNDAREQLYTATGSSFLTPYASWSDFAENLKNPLSVINFIAAYGTHQSIIDAGNDAEARRTAATALVLGTAGETAQQTADRLAFLNGPAATTGVNDIDLWIGGLAEAPLEFGGMLGATFNAVFEAQLENLQDNDRFYYLSRTQGLNLLNELENNAFSKLVMANTDMTDPGPDGIRGTSDDIMNYHGHVDAFTLSDYVLHVDPTKQIGPDPQHNNAALNAQGRTLVQRDNLNTPEIETNFLKFIGADHISINGTNDADRIISGGGDDGIWGGGGNDRIEGGAGVDLIIGGAGNDIITDSGDSGDFLKGEEGDDVIANSNGLDILMGGDGKDAFIVGVDSTEVFGGEGDDFILGGDDADFLLGNEGDDWIEAGGGFDTTAGDNSELFFNSTIIGHDVMFAGADEHDFDAESGDDIMVQGVSVMRNEGMFGFDWSSYQASPIAANADMTISVFNTDQANVLRNRFDLVEALSGSDRNDVLRGDDRGDAVLAGTELTFDNHELTQAGVDRIDGLREALGLGPRNGAPDDEVVFASGNILFGGGGSDTIEGRGGDDFIDGDLRLHVRISIMDQSIGEEMATVTSLKDEVTVNGVTKPLSAHLLTGAIRPAQMHIVREIVNDGAEGDQDTAVYYDDFANYSVGRNADGSLTVSHINPTPGIIDPFTGRARVSDGTDRLNNIEFLQFRDQTLHITQVVNFAPTGAPAISDLTPTEGDVLTVDLATIADPNGVGAFSFQWQVSADGGVTWDNVEGATNSTYAPEDTIPGQILRVAVSYTDGVGTVEQLLSPQTGVVGDLWNATPGNPDFVGTSGQDKAFGDAADNTMTGNAGIDLLDGGGGNDTAAYAGPVQNFIFSLNGSGNLTVRDLTGFAGTDTLVSVENLRFGGVSKLLVNGTNAAQTIDATNAAEIILGQGGFDRIHGRADDDVISGGRGNDIAYGNAGNDAFLWRFGDGWDTFNGGGGTDTVYINGNVGNDAFVIYERTEAISAGFVPKRDATEIVIVRNGKVIAELIGIEEIVVTGGGGSDSFDAIGDFTGTSLAYNTITIEGSLGNDTVDITGLTSAHRVVLHTNGGNDQFVGGMRAQDSMILPDGTVTGGLALPTSSNMPLLNGKLTAPLFADGPRTDGLFFADDGIALPTGMLRSFDRDFGSAVGNLLGSRFNADHQTSQDTGAASELALHLTPLNHDLMGHLSEEKESPLGESRYDSDSFIF